MVLVHRPRTNNVLAMYWVSTSPLAPSVNAYTHGALNVYKYEGENSLVVIKANSIISVVAMVPFREQVEGGCPFFLVEKFALGVLDTGDPIE
jgi:hypothetical protein